MHQNYCQIQYLWGNWQCYWFPQRYIYLLTFWYCCWIINILKRVRISVFFIDSPGDGFTKCYHKAFEYHSSVSCMAQADDRNKASSDAGKNSQNILHIMSTITFYSHKRTFLGIYAARSGNNCCERSQGYNQCVGHRMGILCSSCEMNYSLSMLSSSCVSSEACTDSWIWPLVILAVMLYVIWYTS